MNREEILYSLVSELKQEPYPDHSRSHPLQIGKSYGIDCYIKREDELGCLLSGSKVRKYRSLIAHVKLQGITEACLIGSANSNQVLSLTSLLIENQITPTLFLLRSQGPILGNALFSQLFVPQKQIHFIERSDWPQVETRAQKWQQEGPGRTVICEGIDCDMAFLGLTTLALDILKNEQSLALEFSHILLDSGSATTATTLIALFHFLKRKCHFHILLAAGTKETFNKKLELATDGVSRYTKCPMSLPTEYTLHTPTDAPSFGSTNKKIFESIVRAARSEGILFDPIYSIKLYLLLEKCLAEKKLRPPVLCIHSGGVFSLSGFSTQLSKVAD